MKYYLYFLKFLSIILLFPPLNLCSEFSPFQTTRLKSTGGAGIASLLVNEATLLNPSASAFFPKSSVYFQKGHSSLEDKNSNQTLLPQKAEDTAIIISDNSRALKGSFSFIKQTVPNNQREKTQMGASLAITSGPKSSIGLSYREYKDRFSGTKKEKRGRDITIGVTHLISKDFSTGIIFTNPFKKNTSPSRAMIGLQYLLKDYFVLIGDFGGNHKENLNSSFVYRGAIQIKFLNNFYIRLGVFKDKGLRKKGNGSGVSWIQPRLILNFSINNNIHENSLLAESYTEKESSFSASYRF